MSKIDWANPYDRSPLRGTAREYGVLSHHEAEQGHDLFSEPHVLISITDPGCPPANLPHSDKRRDLLRLCFEDAGNPHASTAPFDEFHAARVAEFVLRQPGHLRLVVHCFAGMSRSAGMVAGIAEASGDHRVVRDCHKRYMPNQHVQRLTLSAMLAYPPQGD